MQNQKPTGDVASVVRAFLTFIAEHIVGSADTAARLKAIESKLDKLIAAQGQQEAQATAALTKQLKTSADALKQAVDTTKEK